MIPTILADGTVLATIAELPNHHSTAQGTWDTPGRR